MKTVRSLLPGIALCLLFVVAANAGPLVNAARNISTEITQVVEAIAGVLLIGWTLFSMSGGIGARMLTALIEAGVFFLLIMNANSIASWFRFS